MSLIYRFHKDELKNNFSFFMREVAKEAKDVKRHESARKPVESGHSSGADRISMTNTTGQVQVTLPAHMAEPPTRVMLWIINPRRRILVIVLKGQVELISVTLLHA